MPFDPLGYGGEVAALLSLAPSSGCSQEVRTRLKAVSSCGLFPASLAPDAALAGLYLYFSCFEEAHEIAQGIPSAEGSYWHAILHRQEPDPDNAAYWFRRVGRHPVFAELGVRAAEIGGRHGISVARPWDPFAFIQLCEKARREPGSKIESAAVEIQRVEWQVLFDYCARPR
jgi:hypothetical protein